MAPESITESVSIPSRTKRGTFYMNQTILSGPTQTTNPAAPYFVIPTKCMIDEPPEVCFKRFCGEGGDIDSCIQEYTDPTNWAKTDHSTSTAKHSTSITDQIWPKLVVFLVVVGVLTLLASVVVSIVERFQRRRQARQAPVPWVILFCGNMRYADYEFRATTPVPLRRMDSACAVWFKCIRKACPWLSLPIAYGYNRAPTRR